MTIHKKERLFLQVTRNVATSSRTQKEVDMLLLPYQRQRSLDVLGGLLYLNLKELVSTERRASQEKSRTMSRNHFWELSSQKGVLKVNYFWNSTSKSSPFKRSSSIYREETIYVWRKINPGGDYQKEPRGLFSIESTTQKVNNLEG